MECVIAKGEFSTKRRLHHYLNFSIGDLDLAGKSILDVGAGNGLLSLAAASAGASVVALEPVGDGSESTCIESFRSLRGCVSDRAEVAFLEKSVQAYLRLTEDDPQFFDAVIMADSINHLDEEAVVDAHVNPSSRERFVGLLALIATRIRKGGSLIVMDCARSNFYGRLGVTNPFAPTITWNLHQDPDFWSGVLHEAGYSVRTVEWSSLNVLGRPGKFLLGNRSASWMLRSHFRIHAVRENS